MADQFNVNFINLGADEAIYKPPNLYTIGRKGDCRVVQINENYAKYDICCYSASGYDWRLADADVANEGCADLWIILSPSGSAGDYVIISRRCWIVDNGTFPSGTYGAYRSQPLWLSQTPGKLLLAPPAGSGVTVRMVAHVEVSGTGIWFEPSNHYTVLP